MTIRKFREANSLGAPRLASGYPREPQVTTSLGHGDSDYGMIPLDYHLGLEEIPFDCLYCRMQSGSLAPQRKVICLLRILQLVVSTLLRLK